MPSRSQKINQMIIESTLSYTRSLNGYISLSENYLAAEVRRCPLIISHVIEDKVLSTKWVAYPLSIQALRVSVQLSTGNKMRRTQQVLHLSSQHVERHDMFIGVLGKDDGSILLFNGWCLVGLRRCIIFTPWRLLLVIHFLDSPSLLLLKFFPLWAQHLHSIGYTAC